MTKDVQTASESKGLKKRILRALAIALVVLLVLCAATLYYVQNQKNKVAAYVLEFLDERYSGELEYDAISLDRWTRLRSPSIYFDNLAIEDTSASNQMKLRIKTLELEFAIVDLLKGTIQAKAVKLDKGVIALNNYTPLTPEELLGLPPKLDSSVVTTELSNALLQKNTRLELSDITLEIRHHIKDKHFQFHIEKINSDIEFSETTIRSRTRMAVEIGTLGFNSAIGGFAEGASVRGTFESLFDLSKRQLDIFTFPVEIGNQVFKSTAKFDFNDIGSFDIMLSNDQTDLASSLTLLPDSISQSLDGINLEKPLDIDVQLQGQFYYQSNPRIKLNFKSEDNAVIIDGEKLLNDVGFSGQFANRVYTDDRALEEGKENLRILIPKLHCRYKSIALSIDDLELASSPDALNKFTGKINAKGSPESLNNLLEGQHWNFQEGSFEMAGEIKGNGMDLESIISSSITTFSLTNTKIINNANQQVLPIVNIGLSLDDNVATLDELRIALNTQDDVVLRAGFTNFSDLFQDGSPSRMHSRFAISSDKLVWDDFLQLMQVSSEDGPTQKSEVIFQDLLRDIQRKYDPAIEIDIGNLDLGPFLLTNVTSSVHFEGADILALERTSFDIDGGGMQLEGRLNLSYPNRIWMTAQLTGSADVHLLNSLLDTSQIQLDGDVFLLDAKLTGDLLQPIGFLRRSVSHLKAKDLSATLLPDNLVFPIAELDMELLEDHAVLNVLTILVGDSSLLTFDGQVEHMSGLLFGVSDEHVRSELHVTSDRLIWQEYLELFGEMEPKQDKAPKTLEELMKAEQNFKASLQDIYSSLNPLFTVDIKEFQYMDMQRFRDFHTGIYFRDQETIQLEETEFLYGKNAAVLLNAEVDIAVDRMTNVVMSINASGDPEELNDFFHSDTFFFSGGTFDLEANIVGDIWHLDSLIAHSDLDLNVSNTVISHRPNNVHIPVTELLVGLHDSTATLESLEVELGSGNHIGLKGEIRHISDLIFDLPLRESRTNSAVSVYASELSFDEFQSLFAVREHAHTPISTDSTEAPKTAIKPTIRDVYRMFRPRLDIVIDEFDLNGLVVTNLTTGLHFASEDSMYLEDTSFDFYDGSVNLNAHLDISQPAKTLFSFGFVTDQIDLEKLLEAFDHFDMPSLQQATRIGGLISLDTEFEGEVDDLGEIIPESLRGKIDFNLEEAEISGFEPLVKAGSKIFKPERVEDIRFMPIENTMTLRNSTIDIPLMEIQSAAINLFVAGELGLGDTPTNIWLGFPLDNLKARDLHSIPDKRGYIAAGKKVYVEAKSDEEKGTRYLLHLSPKQYYAERDMLETYREEIRKERKEIRKYKRMHNRD